MAGNKGLAGFQRRMDRIPKAVREAVQPAVVTSANEIANRMRSLAPVDEGALRDSVAVTGPGGTTPAYSQPGGSTTVGPISAVVTVGSFDVRYAHLVEYGHGNGFNGSVVPPHPFFWPAVRLLKKRSQGRIKRAMAKACREEWSK